MTGSLERTPYTILRQVLTTTLNEGELRTLCFDLGVDYENLVGQSKADKVRELVSQYERRQRLSELIATLEQSHPHLQPHLAGLIPRISAWRDVPCPYRGLQPFEAEHAAVFFGRNATVAALLERIHRSSLVAIVGASGSGKSSLVRAGLIHAVQHQSDPWLVVLVTPGRDPLWSVAIRFVEQLEPHATEVARLAMAHHLVGYLNEDSHIARRLVGRLLERHPGTVLLVLDQFEELFTQGIEPATYCHITDLLLNAADADPRMRVVLVMRADFYEYVLRDPRLGKVFDAGLFNVLPLHPDDIRAAIEHPALATGRRFEPGLVERVLHDIAGSPGDLPLLQFALTELWFRQTPDGMLTHAAYDAIGGVGQALARYAESVYARLDVREQQQMQRVLTQLIQPGEGTTDTRRVTSRDEIGEEYWPLVVRLADTRLVVTHGMTVMQQDRMKTVESAEVVHEALIRGWIRMRHWMDADRAFRTWQERLRAMLHQWEESHHDEGALLRGAPLAEAEEWVQQRFQDLSQREQTFIRTSLELRENEETLREQRRQREIIQAQALAEAEGQRAEAQQRRAEAERLRAEAQQRRAEAEQLRAEEEQRRAEAERLRAEAQQRRAEAEQLRAEEQAATTLRLRLRSVYMAIALLVALVAVVLTSVYGGRSERTADEALQRARHATAQVATVEARLDRMERITAEQASIPLAAAAETALNRGQPDTALALALAAVRMDPDGIQARVALAAAAYAPGAAQRFPHSSREVYCLAVSPDRQRLASGDSTGDVRLWNIAQGIEETWFDGHTASVTSVSFSPDGQMLLSGSKDGTVRLWDVATSTETRQFAPDIRAWTEIHSVTFSPDGTTILVGMDDGIIRQWNVFTGELLRQYAGHEGSVTSLAFSPDGQAYLSGSTDQSLRLWDVASGEERQRFDGHTAQVNNVAFSYDGSLVASAGDDQTIRLWNITTGEEVQRLTGHTGAVTQVVFRPTGDDSTAIPATALLSSSMDGTISMWDSASGILLRQFRGHQAPVYSVAFSPDGRTILSGSRDIRVWDAANELDVLRFDGYTGQASDMALSPDGTMLLVGSTEGWLRVWNPATGQVIYTLDDANTPANSVAFSPDGRLAAAGGSQGTVSLWDAATGVFMRQISPPGSGAIRDIAFHPDSTMILIGREDGIVYLWDMETNRSVSSFGEVDDLFGVAYAIDSVAISPDGQTVAAGGCERQENEICIQGELILWEADSGIEVQQIAAHTDEITSIAFSPDGRTILTGSADATLRIWDVASGDELHRFTGHTNAVTSVAYGSDGTKVLSGSADAMLRLWDVASGMALYQFSGHTGPIIDLAWSPDGQRVFSVAQDGSLRAWTVHTTDELVAWVEMHRYIPDLTCGEREFYGIEPLCDVYGNVPTVTPNTAAE